VRSSSLAIRAVHRRQPDVVAEQTAAAEADLRAAQQALAPFPAVAHAGFLHDAEKEYAEAVLTAALVAGDPLPDHAALGIAVPHLVQDDGRLLALYVRRVKGCDIAAFPLVGAAVGQTLHILALFGLALLVTS